MTTETALPSMNALKVRLYLLLTSLELKIYENFSEGKCPANQEYKDCGPYKTCEKTCDNPTAAGIPCPKICVKGCFCKNGFVKNEAGNCVPLSQCPPKCPLNEVHRDCGPHKSCVGTCQNPYAFGIACPEVCVKGCFCKDGYVRDNAGKCVLVNQCNSESQNP
jgi:Trypsin Inhibitor like cysteine rich domain